MSDKVRDRIRKLLALARDKGASEAEAASAMEVALRMMAQHKLTEQELGEEKEKTIIRGIVFPEDIVWHRYTAQAAAELYSVRIVSGPSNQHERAFVFVGLQDNVEAADDLFQWLNEQIETLYTSFLPKGMTKSERSNYRRTFKGAAAMRTWHQALVIKRRLEGDKATSRALVVVNNQLALVDKHMEDKGVPLVFKAITLHEGRGTGDGLIAGDSVQLNRRTR